MRIQLKKTSLVFLIFCSFSGCFNEPKNELPVIQTPELLEHGKELTQGLAACGRCHGVSPSPSSPLIGGQIVNDYFGEVVSSNITPSLDGIGNWSLSDFLIALRQDQGPSGYNISAQVHNNYRWVSDQDLMSIFAYLRSIQPVKNQITKREIPWLTRNTFGLLESRPHVAGAVPDIKYKSIAARGQYLVDNLAGCAECHNQKAGWLSSFQYLGGGQTREVDGQNVYAPAITGDTVDGIGSWTKSDLIRFLLTGKKADGSFITPTACPVDFYRLADPKDLEAIAEYLKSLP